MDQDGVDADILYPTPRPSIAMVRLQDDPELHLAQVQAYNNWLSEFCSHDLERLGGLAVIPNIGVEAAVLEMRRAMTAICRAEGSASDWSVKSGSARPARCRNACFTASTCT